MKQIINFPGWAKHKGRWVDDSTLYCALQKVLIEVTLAFSMFKCSMWTFNYTRYCFWVCYKKVQRCKGIDVRSTSHSNRLSPKIVKMFLIIVGRGENMEEKALNFKFRVRSLWTIYFLFFLVGLFGFFFIIVLDLNKNKTTFLLSYKFHKSFKLCALLRPKKLTRKRERKIDGFHNQ